jgi:ABC-type sugar transport system substrate-binding protein
MAFKLNISESDVGAAFTDAYARVGFIKGDTRNFFTQVLYYASEEARKANAQPVLSKSYQIPFAEFASADNPIAAGYNWLKTQDEYKTATDA